MKRERPLSQPPLPGLPPPKPGGQCFLCCRPPDNPVRLAVGNGKCLTFCRTCFFNRMLGGGRKRRVLSADLRASAAEAGTRVPAGGAKGGRRS